MAAVADPHSVSPGPMSTPGLVRNAKTAPAASAASDPLSAQVTAAVRAAEHAGDVRSAGVLTSLEVALCQLRMQVRDAAAQLPEYAVLFERLRSLL
jgi:hypothetical protein